MSNQSDTPETDDQLDDARNIVLDFECRNLDEGTVVPVVVPADFARKLERERDNAREKRDGLASTLIDVQRERLALKARSRALADFCRQIYTMRHLIDVQCKEHECLVDAWKSAWENIDAESP